MTKGLIRAKELKISENIRKMMTFENAGRTEINTEAEATYVDLLNELHDSAVDIWEEIDVRVKPKNDKERLDEILAEIATMEITPFGYILDFLIDQGLTLEQVQKWYTDKK